MDFNHITYIKLLETIIKQNYFYQTFEKTVIEKNKFDRIIVLRHDVDNLPTNSLQLAQIEKSLGINATYYFRVVPKSYNLEIMLQIADLGHEIGYHYEDMDLVIKKYKLKIKNDQDRENLIDLAYESFCNNLEMFRKNFEIKTICMHGSPRSKYDNKLIWQKYNYKDLGLIGEPYLDIDFSEFAYFTDTGRRWNGETVSVRDKVVSKFNFDFSSTQQIIDNVQRLPSKVMFTIHPERWHAALFPWAKELVWQNVKNIGKQVLIKFRS